MPTDSLFVIDSSGSKDLFTATVGGFGVGSDLSLNPNFCTYAKIIFVNGLSCQSQVGFLAELAIGSSGGKDLFAATVGGFDVPSRIGILKDHFT